MIICISLYHDHKITLNFESCKIKFTIRHSIVTRIRHFIVTKRLWKSSIAIYQMSKFTRSDDVCLFFQITKSPPFYSMHIHCIKFTVLIPAFFPVSHQLKESRLLSQKKIAVFVLLLLYNLILIKISLIIIFYKQIVGDYF